MGFILRRLLQIPLALLIMMLLIFFAIRLAPGDPAQTMLSAVASADDIQRMRAALGVDKPIYIQFLIYVGNVIRGDLGESLFLHEPVLHVLGPPLLETFKLVTVTMGWVLVLSIPLGIISALYRNSFWDYLITGFIYFGQAAPNFWLGIMLILAFAVRLRLFPTFGGGSVRHMVLPSIALGIALVARVVRFVRSEMIDVLQQDYVRTARSKGLSRRRVILVHALRNVLIPLVTDMGLQYGWLFANAVVIETVFAWPGLGWITVQAISGRDYPLVQASVLVLTTVFILLTALVDIAYQYIDPRIRFDSAA